MTRQELIEKYPGWFRSVQSELMWGFGIEDGWVPLFTELCQAIGESSPPADFRFIQIKEKFGLLRIYYREGNDAIDRLVAKFEQRSGSICELCGSTSQVETKGIERIATWCSECRSGPTPDGIRF